MLCSIYLPQGILQHDPLSNMRTLTEALQRDYMTRASAYRDALQAFMISDLSYDDSDLSPESKKLIDAEAEAIHMILDRIGDDIYSTVDACSTAREIWLAIERLQQGESIKKQDVKIKLF
ncbi:hypothetical protein Tco_0927716 [Tanacetum coccineum]